MVNAAWQRARRIWLAWRFLYSFLESGIDNPVHGFFEYVVGVG